MYDDQYPERVTILCVDDEVNVLRALERIFLDDDFDILTVASGNEGLALLDSNSEVQVIISDYRMPGMNGVEFLREVYRRRPETVRIVLSGYADTAAVVESINEGQIYKFIPKPWNDEELRNTIIKAIDTYFLRQNNLKLTEELRAMNEELLLLNENLEHKVIERTAELSLQNRALAHSQTILDLLPVGVLGVVADGMIVQCNREAAGLLAAEREALLGERLDRVLPAAFRETFFDGKFNLVANRAILTLGGEEVLVRGTRLASGGQDGTIITMIRRADHE